MPYRIKQVSMNDEDSWPTTASDRVPCFIGQRLLSYLSRRRPALSGARL
jgi:hypothetical protein